MTPWYVWLVWCYEASVEVGETGPIRMVGVFSTRDKALEAAFSGCCLTLFSLDEPYVPTGHDYLPAEWVE